MNAADPATLELICDHCGAAVVVHVSAGSAVLKSHLEGDCVMDEPMAAHG